ncbi:hypothetical protein D3C81_1998720 [compost metagenome]
MGVVIGIFVQIQQLVQFRNPRNVPVRNLPAGNKGIARFGQKPHIPLQQPTGFGIAEIRVPGPVQIDLPAGHQLAALRLQSTEDFLMQRRAQGADN